MKITIRSKLILAISLLVVVLFSLSAFLFIKEKKTQMADDIYLNALAFSRLTAPDVAENYDLYLAESGFVYFNREIQALFGQNDDISGLKVVNYSGELLYDSLVDVSQRYVGDARFVDEQLLGDIRSEDVSIRILNDTPLLVDYIVVPANEKYSVIYSLDYHNLDARVDIMVRRIIYLAVFGILLGMILSFIMSTKITNPVHKLKKGVEKIATGDFKTRVDIKTRDEIGFLGDAFNKMAVDLEASMEARLYKERVGRELELAAQIQERIVPDTVPQVDGLDIAAGLIPASEIGGDMYDFLPFKDRFLMYIGDVTGHGVPAGIVSSIASALFYGYSADEDLKRIIVNVNRVLQAKTMPNMFMTLCLMEWDGSKFRYISAGHEKLIHYKAADRSVELAPSGGLALGMMPDVEGHVEIEEINLAPGDFIIAYSDGIPEAWRSEHEKYGMERFVRAVERFGDARTADGMKKALLADVQDFMGGHKQMDDITLVVARKG